MEYFSKKELIRCYREERSERCAECRLLQAARKMPYGVDESIESLVTEVLDPARRKLGMEIIVNSGFRCPIHNSHVGGATGSQHMKGEAADIRCDDNRKLARIIVEQGRFDQLIIYPSFVHVSYKKNGPNRGQILKKVVGKAGYSALSTEEIARLLGPNFKAKN